MKYQYRIADAVGAFGPWTTYEVRPAMLPIPEALAAGGVNLAHKWYLPETFKPNAYDADLLPIRELGAGHIRLPISPNILEDGRTGTLREDRWLLLKGFLAKAAAVGLVTIVDMHSTRELNEGWNWEYSGFMDRIYEEAYRPRHIALMTAIAERIMAECERDSVIFQFGNEPDFSGGNHMVWYDHQDALVASIRAVAPDLWLFVMPHKKQSYESVHWYFQPHTKPWFGDPRIILDCHFYSPGPFTHCVPTPNHNPANAEGLTWPGVYSDWIAGSIYTGVWSRDQLEQRPYRLWDYLAAHPMPLHFSEIGSCSPLADAERAKYIADVIDVLKSHGAGYTVWEWDEWFGINDHPLTLAAALRG